MYSTEACITCGAKNKALEKFIMSTATFTKMDLQLIKE